MTRRTTPFAVAHDTRPASGPAEPGGSARGGDGSSRRAPGGRLSRAVLAGGGLAPAVPLWVWWAVWNGGYPPAVFLPGLLYLLAAAALLATAGPRPRPGRAAMLALAALGALTAWTWASIGWADDRGMAWLAAERTTLYALAFALPVLWPPTLRGLSASVAAWVVAVAAGAAAGIAGTLGAPGGFAIDGRLAAPTIYVNATAALLVMGMLPALGLASRRATHPALRALALGLAAGLGATAMLTQSRGAVVAAAAGFVVLLAVVPRRLAVLIASGIVAGAVALIADALLDVRRGARAGAPVQALEEVLPTIAVAAVAAAALGLVWALVDGRLVPAPRLARTMRGGGVVLAALAVVAGGAAFVRAVEDPGAWAKARWSDFRSEDYARLEASEDRFSGELGSNRYDYWRVAVRNLADEPLTGTGAAGFAAPYVEQRRTDKGPLYAHSLWMQVVSDLGVPGGALLLAWLTAVAVALAGVLRRAAGEGRLAVAMAVVPGVVVLVHGSADWITFFPALAVPALGLLGAAVGQAQAPPPEQAPGQAAPPGPASAARGRLPGRLAVGAAAVALVAAGVLAVPLYLGARLTDRAVATWPTRTAGALADLERARALNPLSPAIPLNEGVIAVEAGDLARARAAFALARERDPSAWYPPLALALLEARDGRRASALRLLRAARARNPREPTLPRLRRQIGAGRAPAIRALQREILARPA